MKTCTTPGCDLPPRAKGLCRRHYQAAWARQQRTPGPGTGPSRRPTRRPPHVLDALHALAESRPTPAEYERRKKQILEGAPR